MEMGRVVETELHEGLRHRAQRQKRVLLGRAASQAPQQTPKSVVYELVQQTVLVPEVVIDRGRAVAAPIAEPTHGKALDTLLEEQSVGRLQNGAARFVALPQATALKGLWGSGDGHAWTRTLLK
jgi:hypothetical protein